VAIANAPHTAVAWKGHTILMSTNGRYATNGRPATSMQRNVLGGPLVVCNSAPRTGFYRTGCCETGTDDPGMHVVCAQMTAAFLAFSQAHGNDLTTPRPEYGFPGLKPGDRWCLCASRWQEALEAGVAPPIVLAATHEAALQVVQRQDLLRHALDIAHGDM